MPPNRSNQWRQDSGYSPGNLTVPPFYQQSEIPPYIIDEHDQVDVTPPPHEPAIPPPLDTGTIFAPDIVPPMGPDYVEPPMPQVEGSWPGDQHMGGHELLQPPQWPTGPAALQPAPNVPELVEGPQAEPPVAETIHAPAAAPVTVHDFGPLSDTHVDVPLPAAPIAPPEAQLSPPDQVVQPYEATLQPPTQTTEPFETHLAPPGPLPPDDLTGSLQQATQGPEAESPGAFSQPLPEGTPQSTWVPEIEPGEEPPATDPFQPPMVPPIGGGYYTPEMPIFMAFSPPSPNQAMGLMDPADPAASPTASAPFAGTVPPPSPAMVMAPAESADFTNTQLLQAIESLRDVISQIGQVGGPFPREPLPPYGGNPPKPYGHTYRESDRSTSRTLVNEAMNIWQTMGTGRSAQMMG